MKKYIGTRLNIFFSKTRVVNIRKIYYSFPQYTEENNLLAHTKKHLKSLTVYDDFKEKNLGKFGIESMFNSIHVVIQNL